MSIDFLYGASHWLIGLGLFAFMAVAYEVGFRLGCRRRLVHEELGQANAIQASILALLGLLLGFTLSMAVSRFELRRVLAVQEVNAIGTAQLRSRAWPEVDRDARPLFIRYTELRLEAWAKPEAIREILAESAAIQEKLWKQALAQVAADPKSVPAGLYMAALNEMFDVQTTRISARRNHVPQVVLLLLDLLAIFSLGSVGYGGGLAHLARSGAALVLAALICMVILIIMDLDRPDRGLIQSDPTGFEMLSTQLKGAP